MKRFLTARHWRYLLVIGIVVALLAFFYTVRSVFSIFVLGAVLAYLLYRPVLYLESLGLNRGWAIIVVYLILFGSLAALLITAVPAMLTELKSLVASVPQYADQIQQAIKGIEAIEIPDKLSATLNKNLNTMEASLYSSISNFFLAFYNFLSKLFAIIIAPILSFYMIYDWDKIREAFLRLLSPGSRREIIILFERIDEVLIGFIRGYLIVSLFVGILTGLVAFILGVSFPVLIGFVAALTNLIPYFGPFLGGIPAVGIALTVSTRTALYMTIAIVVIQQVESSIITPKVIGNEIGLHPLLIVFVLLAGGQLFGIWGMLLAVPITAILRELFSWVHLRLVG